MEREALPRLLVVAPDARLTQRLRALVGAGCILDTVSDAEAALEAITGVAPGESPALLIRTTAVTGVELEFLRRLRLLAGRPGTSVLLVVDTLDEEGRLCALETGADDCLPYGCSDRELRARVERMLDQQIANYGAWEESRRARHWFESIVENVDDHLVVYDREWRYLYVNEGAARVLGKRREELLGQCIWELFPEAVGNQYYRELHQAVAEQRVIRSEHFYAPWGNWYVNQIYPSPFGVIVFSSVINYRKEVEEKIRRSEARYRALVEASSQVVWTWDAGSLGGQYAAVQDWWEQLTGQSPNEQAGDGWLRLVHPEDRETTRSAWAEAMERGTKFEIEYRVRARDGSYSHLLSRAVPVSAGTDPVLEWVGMLVDVTEQRRAEAALRHHEAWLRTITDAVPSMISYVDREHRYRFNNAPYEAWFGQNPREICGRHLREVLGEEVYRERLPFVEAALDGKPLRFEGVTPHRDGRLRITEVSYVPDVQNGEVEGFFVLVHDITERKQAETALQESNRTLQALVDATPLALMILDPDGTVRLWNPAAERLYGWTAAEVLGNTLPAIPADRQDEFHEHLEKIACGAEILSKTIRRHKRGGVPFEARLWAVPLQYPNGRVQCLSIIEDLTDRQRLEAELEQRVEELAEADRRKDEFLAMLAHELRNPLGPILNAVQVLGMREGGEAGSKRLREIIARQARQMARLLDDLLDVSRITRGKIELRLEQQDLVGQVVQAVETCRSVAEQRGHQLVISVPEEPAPAEVDAARLQQILGNLLGNAVKYTPPGGRIAITLKLDGASAVIAVRDNGIGIPPELLPRVFDLFTQGNRSLARAEGGLGIGLTMVKSLVGMHGGRVEVRSDGPGRGSEFLVWLPLTETFPQLPTAVLPEADQRDARHRRVLVVDDLQDGADSLGDLLEAWGYEVCVVYRAEDALHLVQTFAPDILLLDIGLPDLDGYTVARRLRTLPANRGAVLVALTGYGRPEDISRAREAGFDHHLTKPVDPERLRRLLAELVAGPTGETGSA